MIARSTVVAACELAGLEGHLGEHLKPRPLGHEAAEQPFALAALELLEIDLGRLRRGRDGRDQLRRHVQAAMAEDLVLARVEALGQDPDRHAMHQAELDQVPLQMLGPARFAGPGLLLTCLQLPNRRRAIGGATAGATTVLQPNK